MFSSIFKICVQNYAKMSRKESGKKFLISTEDILHKSHFKFMISEPPSL